MEGVALNILTICSGQGDWPAHCERWVRYVLKSNPVAVLNLVWIGDTRPLASEWAKSFFRIKLFGVENLNRLFLNSVRMEATELFHVEHMLYVDCDCDVYENLSFIESGEPELSCVRSTGPRAAWIQQCVDDGLGVPEKEMNNGLLWMRRSYKEEYAKAWEAAGKADDRIRGSVAFNIMLRGVSFGELPYSTSVVWSDVEHLIDAKAVQWCNDRGQAKQ